MFVEWIGITLLFPNIQWIPHSNHHPSLGPSLAHVCHQCFPLRTLTSLTFQTLNLHMISSPTPQKSLSFDSTLTYQLSPLSDIFWSSHSRKYPAVTLGRSRRQRMMKQRKELTFISPCVTCLALCPALTHGASFNSVSKEHQRRRCYSHRLQLGVRK